MVKLKSGCTFPLAFVLLPPRTCLQWITDLVLGVLPLVIEGLDAYPQLVSCKTFYCKARAEGVCEVQTGRRAELGKLYT